MQEPLDAGSPTQVRESQECSASEHLSGTKSDPSLIESAGNDESSNQMVVLSDEELLQQCKLEKYLFRLQIALEAAYGVEYLHRFKTDKYFERSRAQVSLTVLFILLAWLCKYLQARHYSLRSQARQLSC